MASIATHSPINVFHCLTPPLHLSVPLKTFSCSLETPQKMRARPQVSTLLAAAGYFFCLLGSRGASAAPITGAVSSHLLPEQHEVPLLPIQKSVSPPWWDDASDHQGPQTIQKKKDPGLDAERDGKGRVQQAFLWRTTQRPRDAQMQPFSHHINKREEAAEPLAEEQEENEDDELAKITLSLVGEFTDAEEKAIADLPEDKQESKALETIDQKAEAAISKFTDGEKNAILAELPDETEKGLFLKEFPQFSTASKEIAPGQRLNPKARAMRDIIVQLKKDDGHVIEHDGKHALQKRGLGSFRSSFRGRVRNWFRGPKSQRWRSRCRRFCNGAKRKLSPKGGWHLVNEPTKVWYVKTDDSPYWGHLKDVEIEQDRLRGQDIPFRHTNPKGWVEKYKPLYKNQVEEMAIDRTMRQRLGSGEPPRSKASSQTFEDPRSLRNRRARKRPTQSETQQRDRQGGIRIPRPVQQGPSRQKKPGQQGKKQKGRQGGTTKGPVQQKPQQRQGRQPDKNGQSYAEASRYDAQDEQGRRQTIDNHRLLNGGREPTREQLGKLVGDKTDGPGRREPPSKAAKGRGPPDPAPETPNQQGSSPPRTPDQGSSPPDTPKLKDYAAPKTPEQEKIPPGGSKQQDVSPQQTPDRGSVDASSPGPADSKSSSPGPPSGQVEPQRSRETTPLNTFNRLRGSPKNAKTPPNTPERPGTPDSGSGNAGKRLVKRRLSGKSTRKFIQTVNRFFKNLFRKGKNKPLNAINPKKRPTSMGGKKKGGAGKKKTGTSRPTNAGQRSGPDSRRGSPGQGGGSNSRPGSPGRGGGSNSPKSKPGPGQDSGSISPKSKPGVGPDSGSVSPKSKPGVGPDSGSVSPKSKPEVGPDSGSISPKSKPGVGPDSGSVSPKSKPGVGPDSGSASPKSKPGVGQDSGSVSPKSKPGVDPDSGSVSPKSKPGTDQDSGSVPPKAKEDAGQGEAKAGAGQGKGSNAPQVKGGRPGSVERHENSQVPQ
ncbi:hypothetical protein IWX46DRAFT_102390 [Phyllosticta citricarpa]|uniref:Uncharacterized protein n=1 Tax=Phyllosticta citricarpa TaxID=55181 RepID=A0ABR1MBY9_9PEZI